MKKRKKRYRLEVEVREDNGKRVFHGYGGRKKIKVRYNKNERTLRAVLTDTDGTKEIIEMINVVSVTVLEEYTGRTKCSL